MQESPGAPRESNLLAGDRLTSNGSQQRAVQWSGPAARELVQGGSLVAGLDRFVRICTACGAVGYRHDRYCVGCGNCYPEEGSQETTKLLPLHHAPLYCPCCGERIEEGSQENRTEENHSNEGEDSDEQ